MGITIGGNSSPTSAGGRKKFVTTKDKDPNKKFGGVVELLSDAEYQKVKFRFNPAPVKVKRYATKIPALDELLGGGIPYGLTTFYGTAGSGKSLMAREISKLHNSLYFTCEVTGDAPSHKEYPNVTTVDYTRYLPSPDKAIKQLFSIIDREEPELIVIDSLTTFFSKSRKALPESDVREMVSRLHVACDGEIPIIGISELRGTGFNEAPAGGQGVMHGCSMLVKFNRELMRWESHKRMYGKEFGEMCYTVQVMKDKNAVADIFEYEVMLDPENVYALRKVHEVPLPVTEDESKEKVQ